MTKLNVGVIGLGYWGPSYVRNFWAHDDVTVKCACDLSQSAIEKINNNYPQVKTTKNYKDILKDKSIDLVAIATPPNSHYKIAKDALRANKHVVIAKPLTTNSKHANTLLKIAKEKKLMLHGDITYIYTGAVQKICKLINEKDIGTPIYYDSTRSNLGLIQKDVNVIWDLAPHDLAIINYCFGLKPKKLLAVATNHVKNSDNGEMAHITIHYEKNFIAHIHVSWISPVKIRTILIGGTKKMIYFNDVDPDEKVKVYDKGVSIPEDPITPLQPIYRSGDIVIPKLSTEEALFTEVKEIVKQIKNKKVNYKSALMNSEVVQILEACDKSLKTDRAVYL